MALPRSLGESPAGGKFFARRLTIEEMDTWVHFDLPSETQVCSTPKRGFMQALLQVESAAENGG